MNQISSNANETTLVAKPDGLAANAAPALETSTRHLQRPTAQHVDVLVVGAGLSGVGAGYYLQTRCPHRSYLILEGRDAIGGTWDLFRYPAVRSDSDMYTLGYSFRPWRGDMALADGASILAYVRDTAAHFGIDCKIKFGHRVVRASWSTADAWWTVEAEVGSEKAIARYTCKFLYMCSGYYDYEQGYMPGWPGMERFRGCIVHPQRWPLDLDYTGRKVVIIGSGATAVTLLPAMAQIAAHVTMLQRSPTYIITLPARDRVAQWLHRKLPSGLAHRLSRWKNVAFTMYFYNFARLEPELVKRMILRAAQRMLGPDFDVGKHLTPSYKPWDQRLCFVPDADLFKAIRSGKASIATDQIETFTEFGIELRSGDVLEADIIVAATGLNLKLLGGMQVDVDDVCKDLSKAMIYKGMMLSDVPNLAYAVGYTNASWTLKCELTSAYVCRLVNHMTERGYAWCAPRRRDPSIAEEPAVNLTSGYIQRASAMLPKQGSKRPWRLYQNYALDTATLKFGALNDGTMEFGRCQSSKRVA
jgi:cation diffusion facilitator CzcD-associated flavoprotein CzcO